MAADGRMGDSAWEGAGGGPLGLGGMGWDGEGFFGGVVV